MRPSEKPSKEFKERIKEVHDDHAAARGSDSTSFYHHKARVSVHLSRVRVPRKRTKGRMRKGRRK